MYEVLISRDWVAEDDGSGLLRFDATPRHAAVGQWTAVWSIDHPGARRILDAAVDPGQDVRRWGVEVLLTGPDPDTAMSGWVDDVVAVDGSASGFDEDAIIVTGYTDVSILKDAPSYPSPGADTSTVAAATQAAAYDALAGNGWAELLRVIRANVGPTAPVRRRWPFLTIPATPTPLQGGTASVRLRFPTLLDLAREVTAQAGLTVDVVRNGVGGLVLTVSVQRVNDDIAFTREGGTVDATVLRRTAQQATSVLALGQGDLQARVMTRVDAVAPATGWAWPAETTVDATSDADPVSLIQAGAKRLGEVASSLGGQVEVSEAVGWRLGREFLLNDRVPIDAIGGQVGLTAPITGADLSTDEQSGQWRTVPVVGAPLDDEADVLADVITAVKKRGRG